MFRTIFITILVSLFIAAAPAQTGDYTSQLARLSVLTGNKQYREAIDGYKALEAQPGTPSWLKAASEYEIAELYGALHDTDNATAALGRAVQLGFDDCITPRASEHLTTILQSPKAAQALAAMQIKESDFRELVWLKSEVENAEHDTKMMITENISRFDHDPTEIPQAQIPTRPTTSPAVLYWRQLLLLVQHFQREFVQKSDIERIGHVARMSMIRGGASQSAVLESARRARMAAETRRLEIRKRAFVPVTPASDQPKPCSEWK